MDISTKSFSNQKSTTIHLPESTAYQIQDKLYGVITGCAVGDALGALVEGVQKEDLALIYGRIDDFFDHRNLAYFKEHPEKLLKYWRLPGAYTDDTQQFLAILEAYNFIRTLTPDIIAQALVHLFPVSRGIGRGYRLFCQAIRQKGIPWRKAAIPDNAGSGSAMRAGVIGMIFHDRFPELLEQSVLQSCVTHSDIRAHMASVLIATTVGYAIHSSFEAIECLQNVRNFHEKTYERIFTANMVIQQICLREGFTLNNKRDRSLQFILALDIIKEFLKKCENIDDARNRFPELLTAIAKCASQDRLHKYPATGTLNFAMEAPITAYIIFLLFGTNTRNAILQAINLGGDTDTVAAMVGQMSGALIGFNPHWWKYEFVKDADGNPSFKAAFLHPLSAQSIQPEWFMKLLMNFQLLFRVDRFMMSKQIEFPLGLPIVGDNSRLFPFMDFEKYISNKQKRERKKIAADIKSHAEKSFVTDIELVFVKGGCYHMGDTFGDGLGDEKPVHEVFVIDFYIGKYEVTQAQWKEIMGHNPSTFKNCGDNCPVESVSWDDVQEFIRKLNSQSGKNYRLPTEAEWEYAARSGGKSEKWAGTSSESDLGDYAWYYENSGNVTHPVGQKKHNGLGIYDMTGNVWEWCSDWYSRNYYVESPRDNPKGPSSGSGRVLRGGSWNYDAANASASNRSGYAPGDRNYDLGFRLAAPRGQ